MKKTVINLNDRKKQLEAELRAIEENEAKVEKILTEVLPQAKLAVLDLLTKLQSCSVEDDYSAYLLSIVKNYGTTGIALSLLREVMPDQDKLMNARRALGGEYKDDDDNAQMGEGCIREVKEGQSITIFFVKDEPSQTAQAA